jgi:urease accessory protein
VTGQPRAAGEVRLSSKRLGARSVIDGLRQAGSLKALFPRTGEDALTGVLLNTAGGITGGDRFDTILKAGAGTRLTVTTQAAERAYRAQPGSLGRVTNRLAAGPGARLDWLPQETILFDGAALSRRTGIELAEDAVFLGVETLIFGRAAMGEVLGDLRLSDHVTLHRAGRMVFADRLRLSGDAGAHLRRAGIGDGAGAMASVIFAAPGAGEKLEAARRVLDDAGGASAPASGLLFARLLAPDGFALRRILIPLIGLFRADPLPRPWMI